MGRKTDSVPTDGRTTHAGGLSKLATEAAKSSTIVYQGDHFFGYLASRL